MHVYEFGIITQWTKHSLRILEANIDIHRSKMLQILVSQDMHWFEQLEQPKLLESAACSFIWIGRSEAGPSM